MLLFTFVIYALFMLVSANGYVPIIKHDRVWVYVGGFLKYENNVPVDVTVRHFYKFGGHVMINGQEYTSFGLYKSMYFQYNPETITAVDSVWTVTRKKGPVYFTREDEQGNFYVLGENINDGSHSLPNIVISSQDFNSFDANNIDFDENDDYVDCVLYNYNEEDGASMPGLGGCYYYSPEVSELVRYFDSTLEIDGEICRKYSIAYGNYDEREDYDFRDHSIRGFSFIEGVGIVLNGSLAAFDLGFEACLGGHYSNEFYAGQYSGLEGIYDENEEPIYIYDEKWHNNLMGILSSGTIAKDDNLSYANIFDLYGRQIEFPLPGTIYIRDGKKYIAR